MGLLDKDGIPGSDEGYKQDGFTPAAGNPICVPQKLLNIQTAKEIMINWYMDENGNTNSHARGKYLQ